MNDLAVRLISVYLIGSVHTVTIIFSLLLQGHCDWHSLSNITLSEPPIWQMVVPNDRTSSVVMFVAPGPPNPASTDVCITLKYTRKLEIWGRAQRETARRRKSDWGDA